MPPTQLSKSHEDLYNLGCEDLYALTMDCSIKDGSIPRGAAIRQFRYLLSLLICISCLTQQVYLQATEDVQSSSSSKYSKSSKATIQADNGDGRRSLVEPR